MMRRALSDEEVKEIRLKYKPFGRGPTMKQIADEYDVSSYTIYHVLRRRGAYADPDSNENRGSTISSAVEPCDNPKGVAALDIQLDAPPPTTRREMLREARVCLNQIIPELITNRVDRQNIVRALDMINAALREG